MEKPPPPSREKTIATILKASERSTLPIRASFIQRRKEGARQGGPLAELVRRGRDSTIEQYLLLHAWASGGDFAVIRDSRVWARALGLAEDESGRRTVGRNWRVLSDLKLVETRRVGREVRVELLREDGTGRVYSHPIKTKERYLQLPYEYWLEGFHEKLDVPGKAVLLIALTLGDWFPLPTRRGPEWYGLSRSTLERGFKSARRASVLEMRWAYKDAPLAPEGHTRENYYRLLSPFGPRGRLAASTHQVFRDEAERAASKTAKAKGKRKAKTARQPKPKSTGRAR